MSVTYFYSDDGTLSSYRNRCSFSDFTNYTASNRGGITLRNNISTMRISNSGRYLGSGFSSPSGMTYFNRHGGVGTHIMSY
ncbi:MAG: hypothetical protein U0K23_08055 [Selenomonadaceae bacterium]|jgi:hypothetical protein|nr:hypothetical protein [Selenomonadaceae bacterium]